MKSEQCKLKHLVFKKQDIIDYYHATTPDYEGWSKSYNMHFGYFSFKNWRHFFSNIWRLEPQLNQASEVIFEKLNIKEKGHYLDMGCGLGASARQFAKLYPKSKITGITIVRSQVERARKLLKEEQPETQNVDFQRMDYQDTDFIGETFDGVYALESACYARGKGRQDFLSEAYRLLKPNGMLVVNDAFTQESNSRFNPVYRYAYHWLCKGWIVEDYINKDKFEEELKRQGFRDIHFKNAFWNALPSALHMPRVITVYALKKMLFSKDFYCNKHLRKQRINHCFGSIAAIFVALHTKRFGYFVVTARK